MRREGFELWKSGGALLLATLSTVGLSGCGSSDAPPAVSINQGAQDEKPADSAPASPRPVQVTADQPSGQGRTNPAQVSSPPPPTSFSDPDPNPNQGNRFSGENQTVNRDQVPVGQPANTLTGAEAEPQESISAAELTAQIASQPIPKGDAEAILKYTNELTSVPFPDNATPAELRDFAKMIYGNVLAAADQVLAIQNATSKQRRAAVQFKFNAYEMLASIEPEKAEALNKERMAFAESMAGTNDPEVSRLARLFIFETMLGEFAQGNEELFQAVLEDAKYIIDDPGADMMHFNVAQNAATVFARMGHSDQALDILGMMKKAFSGSQNEQLAAQAAELDDLILQYKIVGSMMAAANGNQEAGEQMLRHLRDWIELRGEESLEPLQLISNIEMQMEDFGKVEIAKKLTAMMVENYGSHTNPQVAQSVAVSAANAEKRLGLLGNKFQLEGVYLDGSPLKWEDYRGKYVLVDFWASWCSACIDEMDNIKGVYAKYRQRGFEVVGVNLDDNREARDYFFQHHQIPWATVVSGNPDAQGMNDPNAVRCGIEALPFLVLIDPEGKVVEMNPRGERLDELLESIFSQQPAAQAASTDSMLEVKPIR
ncbi:MAG: TlpA disulfide reductase family protein [Pirellulaceae bacterium]